MRIQKIILLTLVSLVVVLMAALLILNWMFEEDSPEYVDSISHHVGAQSVLAVLAHPDDEQLITGLLIRAAEDSATRTAVLTMTKGEAGTPLPQISRLEDLGWVRKAEALKNTWALGVERHEVLDFPDGGLAEAPTGDLMAAVTTSILAHRPDLIVTFWPASGFSNHKDHKRVGTVVEQVIAQLREAPVDGYAGPTHIAYPLAPTHMMSRFAGNMGKTVIANQPLANYSQHGEGWAKLRGWKIHASQANYVWDAYGLPACLVHTLYDKEFFYLLENDAQNNPH